MPFDFLRRKKGEDAKPAETGTGRRLYAARGIAFDGLTEEWRLTGLMQIEGRLSDALNKRHAVPITEVRWAPVDGSAPLTDAPGLRSIDPYDLIVVLAGEGSQPPLTDEERAALSWSRGRERTQTPAVRKRRVAPPADQTSMVRPGAGRLCRRMSRVRRFGTTGWSRTSSRLCRRGCPGREAVTHLALTISSSLPSPVIRGLIGRPTSVTRFAFPKPRFTRGDSCSATVVTAYFACAFVSQLA